MNSIQLQRHLTAISLSTIRIHPQCKHEGKTGFSHYLIWSFIMSLMKGGFRRLSSWNSSLFKQMGLPPKDVSASQSLLPFSLRAEPHTFDTLWICQFYSGLAHYKINYHRFIVVLEVTGFLRSATGISEEASKEEF